MSTRWVADRFVDALAAEPGIEQRMRTCVRACAARRMRWTRPCSWRPAAGTEGPFDVVVNALWEGRLAVDASVGLPMPPTWSHRFRLSAFLRTSRDVDVPSTVIATGPFGDVKNYNGRDLYLSWYLTGLVAEGTAVEPPPLPALHEVDRTRIVDEIASLGAIVPSVTALRSASRRPPRRGLGLRRRARLPRPG